MKKALGTFALTIAVLFSSASFAEWTKVAESSSVTFYIDFERIKKKDGFVYVWTLHDRLMPSITGDYSDKTLLQIDCVEQQYDTLYLITYDEPMGEGAKTTSAPETMFGWMKSRPSSPIGQIVARACAGK